MKAAIVALLALAGTAYADDTMTTAPGEMAPIAIAAPGPDHARELEVHVAGGVEITGGQGMIGGGFRGRASLGKAFGSGAIRPQLALGATFGSGSISVDDPRGLDGSLSIHVRSYGPEAQLGFRFVNGGRVDSRIYASVAVLRVDLDHRLMYDTVAGISGSGSTGVRTSIGANWADHAPYLPTLVEAVYERDAGSGRYGMMLGWGI